MKRLPIQPKLFHARRCIVCGCTDRRACDGGCEWIFTAPPVCSTCVQAFMFARLWKAIFLMERSETPEMASAAKSLRHSYDAAGQKTERWGLPSLRRVCAINRREAKWAGTEAGA